ncbi:coatomer epsilon subunit-domain-containing protein [Limtongia smithiae]|uniref:coatomer epsilon subunit-domain-containing protein n=1 Tax=Limtongia smithiae TaxID=1125753 RepID=UPI0034CE8227
MDQFSDSGELFTIHNLFYQGAYREVLEVSLDGFSASALTLARVYHYRAAIALGDAAAVLEELEDTEGSAALASVKAFALSKTGKVDEALEIVEELVDTASSDSTVQVLGAIVLYLAGKLDDALLLLSKHEGNLAAVALVVQIRLAQNKLDLAAKEIQQVRKYGQDNIVVNLAEAWVNLQSGGDKYQEAFYIYEELTQAPLSSNARTFLGQVVADIQLGRYPEAEDAISAALERDPKCPEVLVDAIVLSTLLGKDSTTYHQTLAEVDATNPFLVDLEEKSSLFDTCAAQFAV